MHDQPLSIDYRLVVRGWAECDVVCGEQRVALVASYLSDALGDLATATRMLLEGEPDWRVSFADEPGESRWALERLPPVDGEPDRVRVRIRRFDKTFSRKSDDDGKLLFDATVPAESFFLAVLGALRGVLDRHGEAGYLEQWVKHPFPRRAYDELERRVGAARTHRRPGS